MTLPWRQDNFCNMYTEQEIQKLLTPWTIFLPPPFWPLWPFCSHIFSIINSTVCDSKLKTIKKTKRNKLKQTKHSQPNNSNENRTTTCWPLFLPLITLIWNCISENVWLAAYNLFLVIIRNVALSTAFYPPLIFMHAYNTGHSFWCSAMEVFTNAQVPVRLGKL